MAEIDKENLRTVPLTALGAFDLGMQGRRVSLLIYHRDGMTAAPLSPGEAVVVGRSVPSDVCVPHSSLSRQHARFELARDDQIWVEDLGSTNSTFVEGEAIERCEVEVGQDVVLGEVTVTIHALSPAEGHQPGLSGHDRFLARLEEEVIRHRTFGRQLGLILVQAADRKRGQLGRWCGRVRALLRPVDRLSLYSLSAVEIALPEADEAMVRQLSGAIVHGQEKGEPSLLCGAALFPAAATSAEELLEAVRTAAQSARIEDPVQLVSSVETKTPPAAGEPIAASPAMKRVYSSVDRLARAAIPALIVGETGSGKEVVSRAIHQRSKRKDAPLRCINCAAIPNQLLESILFGHEKGAFTGADKRSSGIFRDAAGGTVLLDEIGELSAEAQAALLRTLETKMVMRVGSTDEEEVDVRVLAATHRNLEAMCDAGEFRWDLLYRINTVTLQIPPLRERTEEIAPLALVFLRQANEENGFEVDGIEPEAMTILQGYTWPGNVRELRNVIHRATVMTFGETITVADLPEKICQGVRVRAEEQLSAEPAPAGDAAEPGEECAADELARVAAEVLADSDLDYKRRIQLLEEVLIRRTLAETRGNQTATAQRLGIPLRTLSHKIRSMGIEIPR